MGIKNSLGRGIQVRGELKVRSLFRRLLITFSLIFIINFIFAGVLLYYSLGSFIEDSKKGELENSCNNIIEVYEHYPTQSNTGINMFDMFINSMSGETGSEIWVINRYGIIEHSSANLTESKANIVYTPNGYALSDMKQYNNVVEAGKKGVKVMGDYYGLFEDEANDYYTIAKPIYGPEGQPDHVILMFIKLPGVMRSRVVAVNTYILSGIIVLFFAIAMIYIWALRFTKPINEMKDAVQNIAKGQFEKRVNEKYKNEIGDLAKSFNLMAESLEQVESTRREFVANVSHELRTPTTSMRGFLDAILDGTVPEEKQKFYLQIVRDETVRLGNLIEELLKLTRLQSGEYHLEMQKFDINELVRLCIIKLGSLVDNKKIEIKVSFQRERQMVMANKEAIGRVVINFLSNAIKYTDVGGMIDISVIIVRGSVMVRVQDSGPGISEEDCKNIFERFYKADKSRGNDKMGTGLGLSIAKQTIIAHGEDIGVKSKLGEGSMFYFTLKPCE